MGLKDRPYVGTWRLNGRGLVQHTPDALVYVNGDTGLPGCSKCSGKLDLQRFITEVSVDAGTEPGSASATFSLAIPLHHNESFARDAKFLLRPGLEVHIYMRGYFAVQGLFAPLAEPKLKSKIVGGVATPEVATPTSDAGAFVISPTVAKLFDGLRQPINQKGGPFFTKEPLTPEQRATVEAIYTTLRKEGLPPAFALAAIDQARWESNWRPDATNYGKTKTGAAFGLFQLNVFGGLGNPTQKFMGGKKAGTALQAQADPEHIYNAHDPSINTRRIAVAAKGRKTHTDASKSPAQHFQSFYFSGLGAGYKVDEERRARGEFRGRQGAVMFGSSVWNDKSFSKKVIAEEAALQAAAAAAAAAAAPTGKETAGMEKDPGRKANKAQFGPSVLAENGLEGLGLENTLAYPYYHVFHGVVTEVSHSYSGGVSTVSVNCSSMLHFWQYQNMSTNASLFGARPRNSKLKMSLVGHNFTGMHPYQIIYTLHHDMVGAAGGVGFALSSKTNQTAVTEFGGESLFSLNIRYWEKRFRRGIKLRMHGATGELFSTMAAAWLGRTSSARIMQLMRNRFSQAKLDKTQGVMEAQATGLTNKGKRQALAATQFAANSKGADPDNSPRFGLNIVEMIAYKSDIGNWGQVNLFESSYESKLDVAQKVMQITGFEFYQDVDGDFVFKPPMWNLDTSGSRVYRIEDIDIINISFSEKEPQVTYMTCKGSHFKNLGGTGLENEWGVRGQYIDYRLVAQFGWRPGTYETAYFNDPKSMFFSAVNRMDVMNIGINSAQVTIPVRAELRPGYPVYIPYLDCYYYCNSFSHSHAVGGQCTTTLQLVGKRAKFFAPGRPAEPIQGTTGGLSDIDLGNTILPQRPLRVLNQEGKPVLAGFPNVVMALDPNAINPLFFVVGNDYADLSDARTVRNLLDFGVQEKVLIPPDTQDGPQVYTMTSERRTTLGGDSVPITVQFYFQEDDLTGTAKIPDEYKAVGEEASSGAVQTFNIIAQAIEYEKAVKKAVATAEDDQEALEKIKYEILDKQAEVSELQNGPDRDEPETVAKIKSLTDQILDKEKELKDKTSDANEKKRALEAAWRNPSNSKLLGVAFLLEMLNQIGAAYRANDAYGERTDLSSTVNLLDMLSDKKATFSNGTQPGYYRYYSASHPDPAHQAPPVIEYKGKKTVTKPRAPLDEAPTIMQFAPYPQFPPGAKPPEAGLVEGKPQVGIKVLDGSGEKNGKAYSTSDILELMFTVQPVTISKEATRVYRTTNIGELGKDALAKIRTDLAGLQEAAGTPNKDITLGDYFKPFWDKVVLLVASSYNGAFQKAKEFGYTIPESALTAFSGPSLQVFKAKVPFETKWSALKYKDNAAGKIPLGAKGGSASLTGVAKAATSSLAFRAYKEVGRTRRNIAKAVTKLGATKAQVEEIVQAYNNAASAGIGVAVKGSSKRKGKVTVAKKQTTFSPVFPVSDARGYEVVGSYRYGREVGIEPGGVWDQLRKKDLFGLLDKRTVEQVLRFFVQRKGSITVPDMETTEVGGVKKTSPVGKTKTLKGAEAAQWLNEEVLRQLRAANLTDRQILDYGFLLEGDKDATQLEFSLANIFADENLDAIHKIPVINAAYSLADLNLQQAGHICACKSAEADVHLTAFGQEQFLQFAESGNDMPEGLGEMDEGTQWVALSAAQAAQSWRVQQEALRGQVLDRGGSHIVKSFVETFGIDTGPGGEELGITPGARDSAFANVGAREKAELEAAQRRFDALLEDD